MIDITAHPILVIGAPVTSYLRGHDEFQRIQVHYCTRDLLQCVGVCAGETSIEALQWVGNLLVWATPVVVRVHDTSVHTLVGSISRPKGGGQSGYGGCSLVLQEDSSLFICWADCLKVKTGGRLMRGFFPHMFNCSTNLSRLSAAHSLAEAWFGDAGIQT